LTRPDVSFNFKCLCTACTQVWNRIYELSFVRRTIHVAGESPFSMGLIFPKECQEIRSSVLFTFDFTTYRISELVFRIKFISCNASAVSADFCDFFQCFRVDKVTRIQLITRKLLPRLKKLYDVRWLSDNDSMKAHSYMEETYSNTFVGVGWMHCTGDHKHKGNEYSK
jgi:hypothetical protein